MVTISKYIKFSEELLLYLATQNTIKAHNLVHYSQNSSSVPPKGELTNSLLQIIGKLSDLIKKTEIYIFDS